MYIQDTQSMRAHLAVGLAAIQIAKCAPSKYILLKTSGHIVLGCALFSKFLRLNAVLVELDELSSGVPSFFKSEHGKLLRIAILCLVTWVSRGTCVMVS